MNEERILRKLVSAARGDGPPLVDVSTRLALGRPARLQAGNVLLWAFSAMASAAAAVVVAMAIHMLLEQQDPVAEFLGSVSGMMQ